MTETHLLQPHAGAAVPMPPGLGSLHCLPPSDTPPPLDSSGLVLPSFVPQGPVQFTDNISTSLFSEVSSVTFICYFCLLPTHCPLLGTEPSGCL